MPTNDNIKRSLIDHFTFRKKGRSKTVAIIGRYCTTMIAFLFLVIMMLVVPTESFEEHYMRMIVLMGTAIAEGLFGVYTNLSLRLRAIEEERETLPAKRR